MGIELDGKHDGAICMRHVRIIHESGGYVLRFNFYSKNIGSLCKTYRVAIYTFHILNGVKPSNTNFPLQKVGVFVEYM